MRTFFTAGMLLLPLTALADDPADEVSVAGRGEILGSVGYVEGALSWQLRSDVRAGVHLTERVAVSLQAAYALDAGSGSVKRVAFEGHPGNHPALPITALNGLAMLRVDLTPARGTLAVAGRPVGLRLLASPLVGAVHTTDLPSSDPDESVQRQVHPTLGLSVGPRLVGERWTLGAEVEHLGWIEEYAFEVEPVLTRRTTVHLGAGVLFGRSGR